MTKHSVTATERRVIDWPANRPTDEVIAERMLAAALHNYHRALTTGRDGREFQMKTWPEMTDEQQQFYVEWAIPQAMQVIWRGR